MKGITARDASRDIGEELLQIVSKNPRLARQSPAPCSRSTQWSGPMSLSIALSLLLATTTAQAKPAPGPEDAFCGEAMSIYLPSPQGTPAPNIELKNFQYMSPDDRCGRNIDSDELMRLHQAIKQVAAALFATSTTGFGVKVRYTLTPKAPATFDMQTSGTGEAQAGMLTDFYNRASALKEFHSSRGTVYVLFEYRISPAKPSPPNRKR